MNIKTILTGKGEHNGNCRWLTLVAVVLLGSASLQAQVEQKTAISPEARAYFESLVAKQDTAQLRLVNKWHKDSFKKRLSFHTNMLDWLMLVPNFSIEMDTKQTTRTNWSMMLTGKFNGGKAGKYDRNRSRGSFRFDVAGVRFEARHYWRTGKFGKKVAYHDDYVKLNTNIKDSIGYNADSLSSSSYNRYHKVRRNVFSARTIDNPRNWRAYYVGPWAAYDAWNIAIRNKGKSGKGLAVGVTAGWDIPLLPQRYPKEGSLDLDLGAYIGAKLVKYDAWNWEDATRECILDDAKSKNSWSIVPFPIVQDIHVGLVWRFRGIKSKVDLSLVDDYENKIEAYKNRMDRKKELRDSTIARNKFLADSTAVRNAFVADSTQYWDSYNLRRLKNALMLNPDTTFTGDDYKLYLKLIKGIDPTEANIKKIAAEDAKVAKQKAAEQKKADAQAAAEQKKAEVAEKKAAKKQAAEDAKAAKAAAKKKAKGVIETADSVATDAVEEVKEEATETKEEVKETVSEVKETVTEAVTVAEAVPQDAKAAKKAAAEAKKKAAAEAKQAAADAKKKAAEEKKAAAEAKKQAAADAKQAAIDKKKAEIEAKKKAKEEAAEAKKAAAEAKKQAKEAKKASGKNDENSED